MFWAFVWIKGQPYQLLCCRCYGGQLAVKEIHACFSASQQQVNLWPRHCCHQALPAELEEQLRDWRIEEAPKRVIVNDTTVICPANVCIYTSNANLWCVVAAAALDSAGMNVRMNALQFSRFAHQWEILFFNICIRIWPSCSHPSF